MSLVQFETNYKNSFDYITGSKAIKEKKVEVRELSSEGNVNNLAVLNYSKQYVFFSDGDILIGAKQNRVLNTSILLSPESKTVIPVSCIEAGRWSFKNSKFSDSEFHAPANMRYEKARKVKENLKMKKEFDADQGSIWRKVSEYQNSYACSSPTSDLNFVFENKRRDFEDTISKFIPDKKANGIAIFMNSELRTVDIFNRSDVYSEYFLKLLKSVSFEMPRISRRKKSMTEAEGKFKTLDFMDNIEKLPVEHHKGVGEGYERRFSNQYITGFELIYKDYSIHYTALDFKAGK